MARGTMTCGRLKDDYMLLTYSSRTPEISFCKARPCKPIFFDGDPNANTAEPQFPSYVRCVQDMGHAEYDPCDLWGRLDDHA